MSKPAAIKPVRKSKHVFACVYAFSGGGKTRFVGSGGKGTLILHPPTDHLDSIRMPGVEGWEMSDWSDMTEAQEYFRSGGAKEWDWVWLDSVSLFNDHGMDDIFADEVARYPHRKTYGWDKGEYFRNSQRLAEWFRNMVGMDTVNFGWTAHPELLTIDASGTIKLMPYVQVRNMSNKLCGYMNVVAYLEVVNSNGKPRRVMRFNSTEDYFAKDQYDAFEKGRLVDPTMGKFMEKINAARAKDAPRSRRRGTTTRRRTRRTRKG